MFIAHLSETMTSRQSLQWPWPWCHLSAESNLIHLFVMNLKLICLKRISMNCIVAKYCYNFFFFFVIMNVKMSVFSELIQMSSVTCQGSPSWTACASCASPARRNSWAGLCLHISMSTLHQVKSWSLPPPRLLSNPYNRGQAVSKMLQKW